MKFIKFLKSLYIKYKREILVGVVVSLITAAIIEFGDWLVEIVPVVGVSIFETITNITYSFAATHSNSYILRLFIFCVIGILGGSILSPIINGLKIYKSVLSLERKRKKISPDKLETIDKKIYNELQSQDKQDEVVNIPELINRGKKLGKSVISLILVSLFFYIFTSLFVLKPMTLSNKFEQDIVKIAPYVDDSDIKKLKSDWVCMRSKADYDEIYKFIDSIEDTYFLPN